MLVYFFFDKLAKKKYFLSRKSHWDCTIENNDQVQPLFAQLHVTQKFWAYCKGLMTKLSFICMPRCAKVRFWRFFGLLHHEKGIIVLTILLFSCALAWLNFQYRLDDSACPVKSRSRPMNRQQKWHRDNLKREKNRFEVQKRDYKIQAFRNR